MVNINFNVVGVDDVTTDPTIRFKCSTNDGESLYIGSDSTHSSGHVWQYKNGAWKRITENLTSQDFRSVNSLVFKQGTLYAATGRDYLDYGYGQVWSNNGNGWKTTGLVGTFNYNTLIRKLLKVENDIYAVGSFAYVWRFNGSTWSELFSGGVDCAHWVDLETDGSAVYGTAVSLALNSVSGVVKYDKVSTTQISASGFGDPENFMITKLCYYDNKLYGGTYNEKTGAEIWVYNLGSWTREVNLGFDERNNYNVVDMKVINGALVVSIENPTGGQVWAYTQIDGWVKQIFTSDVKYNSYLIESFNGNNFLIGQQRMNVIPDASSVTYLTNNQRLSKQIAYWGDGSHGLVPLGNDRFRFFNFNAYRTTVSEGTLEDPAETIISPLYDIPGDLGALGTIYATVNPSVTAFGLRFTSAQDWKPDAVSGLLGQVFDITNTSGIFYYAAGPCYYDEENNVLLSFCHTEEGYWTGAGTPGGGWEGTTRLQVSFDKGLTFYDAGNILVSPTIANPTGSVTGAVPIQGVMENVAYCYRDGDYLYAYYAGDRLYANNGSPDEYTVLGLARAPYTEVITSALSKKASTWYKYFNGSFSQSGVGGSSTEIFSSYVLPTRRHPNGFYSNEFNKHCLAFNNPVKIFDSNLYYFAVSSSNDINVIYSQDGFNFGYPQRVNITDKGCNYVTFYGENSHLGLGSKNMKVMFTPLASWQETNLQKFSSISLDEISKNRSYSIGRYLPTFKVSHTLDRGQLHPFVATMHYIGEQAKSLEASTYYYYNPSDYVKDNKWKNVLQSYANSSTELSGDFPNSFDDYINFKFGRDFHKFYEEYTHTFNAHRTSPIVTQQDGPVILAHALGSLLYNSDFSKRGWLTITYPNLITTNLANTIEFRAREGVFSSSGTASGTYIASSILNLGQRQNEYRNSGILDHVELCQVSGSSKNNNFVLIDIDPSFKTSVTRNNLLHDNILIKQSAYDGFGRIIFDISKYTLDSNLYDISKNFLSPNHEFNIKFKSIISDSEGLSYGGGTIGVWIHTKPEMNKLWSFTKDGQWVQHSASSITIPEVLLKSHLIDLPRIQRDSKKYKCIKFLDKNNPNRKNDVIASISEDDFTEISLNFHTRNHTCVGIDNTDVPQDYFENISNHVHRLNQNYVIEIFTLPSQDDKFTLYYDLSMIDLTLNKLSKPLITGIPNGSTMGEIYCQEFRVDLDKQQLLNIIKYFNQIRGEYSKPGYTGINNLTGYASREALITSGIYETSGGSRLNYTESPLWNSVSLNTSSLIETITIIN